MNELTDRIFRKLGRVEVLVGGGKKWFLFSCGAAIPNYKRVRGKVHIKRCELGKRLEIKCSRNGVGAKVKTKVYCSRGFVKKISV